MTRPRASSVAWLLTIGLFASRADAQQPVQPVQPVPQPQPPPTAPPQRPWPESPAKQADSPPIPQPPPTGDQPPLSASGTDLVPPPAAAPPAIVLGDQGAGARVESRMRELEARLAADEERMRRDEARTRWLRHLKIGAYVQPQLLVQSFNANASPNQQNGVLPDGISSNDVVAKSDGTTTNGTMFRMRRTRLRTTFATDTTRLYLEIDPFPVGGVGPGIGTVVRDAEATGIARWTHGVRTELGAGVFMVPVSLELLERSDVRPFIERSWAIQNVFPLERDIGVHAKTFAMNDRLQLDVGVVNGQRLGEPHFVAEPDLNKSKDVFGHLKYRVSWLTFGVAGYVGRGQTVDAQNLRFKQFERWWVNYEIGAHHRFLRGLGETHLVAELAIAQNMDTGVNYPFAVPAIQKNLSDAVINLDERSLVIRFEQELTRWGLVGYRYDFYSTDTSIKNNARDTHAFVTVVRFTPNLRWMNEVDYAIDNIHRSGQDAPARHILAFSSVLQAGF
jgi:hypothetical protein